MLFFRKIYFNRPFYLTSFLITGLFVLSYFWPVLFATARLLLIALIIIIVLEAFILFRFKSGVIGERFLPVKFSNGDENPVNLHIKNSYPVTVKLTVIDELPVQFQYRSFKLKLELKAGQVKKKNYIVKPVARGVYNFGALNVYASVLLFLIQRRYQFNQDVSVSVYPSFIQMRRYELYAVSDRLNEAGVKKIRQIGHTMEFDRICKYVMGDDFRTINWKASARKAKLMVNQYQDEKSQQVYSIIDMGRLMKMPFEGMTLLDYAINSSLVISNVAIHKQDKAGIITFSDKMHSVLPASRHYNQMRKILEVLYKQQTVFKESDYEQLYAGITHKIKQRSLILLYTNFESLPGLQRQLGYLRNLARRHLLAVIFFVNTELDVLQKENVKNTEELYIKTIAAKFAYEKKQILYELNRYGIHHILTKPQDLTVSTLNKYLEIKARGLI